MQIFSSILIGSIYRDKVMDDIAGAVLLVPAMITIPNTPRLETITTTIVAIT